MCKWLLTVFLACLPLLPVLAEENLDELVGFSRKKQEGLVVKVTRADEIILENGQRIRLIGIESAGEPPRKYRVDMQEPNTNSTQPRTVHEPEPEIEIPLEEQALTYAKELMEGKKVKLEYDTQAVDDNGYRTAYIFLPDGKLANAELLRQGMVRLKIRLPNVKFAEQLREAYQQARREQRGFLAD